MKVWGRQSLNRYNCSTLNLIFGWRWQPKVAQQEIIQVRDEMLEKGFNQELMLLYNHNSVGMGIMQMNRDMPTGRVHVLAQTFGMEAATWEEMEASDVQDEYLKVMHL
jgi:hypothetical protein